MVFCPYCEAEIVADAQACWKCGRAYPFRRFQEEGRWEYCTIIHRHHLADDALQTQNRFEARVVSHEGSYVVGESPIWVTSGMALSRNDKHAVTALHELVARLYREGWQYMDRGVQWYQGHFGRKVA